MILYRLYSEHNIQNGRISIESGLKWIFDTGRIIYRFVFLNRPRWKVCTNLRSCSATAANSANDQMKGKYDGKAWNIYGIKHIVMNRYSIYLGKATAGSRKTAVRIISMTRVVTLGPSQVTNQGPGSSTSISCQGRPIVRRFLIPN